jgi:glycosyltransferase involved in cell wall biosynthesis
MSTSGGHHAGLQASIVIPTKDRPRDVRRAVTCALAQQGVQVEVVVVDDGSRTPVSETLADLVLGHPGRLRIVRSPEPTGVANARNRGLAAARAPWVGFCDDDDMWAPAKVRHQLDAAAVATDDADGNSVDGDSGDDGVGWTLSACVKVDEHLRVFQRQHVPDPATVADGILAANLVPGGASSVVARTDLVRRLGGFDPTFSTLADWDLWVRLANASRLAVVDEPLVGYVVQADSMSADTALLAEDLDRFLAKHRDERLARGVAFDTANWRRYVGDMELRAHRRLAAARNYWSASLRGHPTAWKVGLVAAVSPRRARTRLHGARRERIDAMGLGDFQAWIFAAAAEADGRPSPASARSVSQGMSAVRPYLGSQAIR